MRPRLGDVMSRISLVILELTLASSALTGCYDSGEPPKAARSNSTENVGIVQGEPTRFRSVHLGAEIVVLPGVFEPTEAEIRVLPYMEQERDLFPGSAVLEIGTGSGIISLFAAKLGAKRVVSTDINEAAIACANENATTLGYDSVIETRLVPLSDMSAFSTVAQDEAFDVIISNPPYSLDLDAEVNTAVIDTGDLGFSIVRGLNRHLRPSGVCVLFYNSTFYHHVMVKYARHMGFLVSNEVPVVFAPWECEALFNSYLGKLLKREGVDPDAFRFDRTVDDLLLVSRKGPKTPLDGPPSRLFPGFVVIRRP
jgi:predicted RNA methylase